MINITISYLLALLLLHLLREQERGREIQQSIRKSDFIAGLTHDLRNAMNPIGNFLDVSRVALSRERIDEAREYLNDASVASDIMRGTLNTVLDIFELESGMMKIKYTDFDLHELLNDMLEQNLPMARAQHVTLRLSRRTVYVSSDRQHLQRVLNNLLSNAIKYADSAKTPSFVLIAVVCTGQQVRIDLIDNGIGIDHEEQNNIFKLLYQSNNAERDRDKGMGLGLSIVKSTMDSLKNHRIKLRSHLGKGTRFTLTLPKAKPPSLAPPRGTRLNGLFILLIEHDRVVKESVVRLLEENGAQHETVTSLAELKTLLTQLQRDPDVVITAASLPQRAKASDALALIKQTIGYELPMIIMTNHAQEQYITDLSILQKPVAAEKLLTEICRLNQ